MSVDQRRGFFDLIIKAYGGQNAENIVPEINEIAFLIPPKFLSIN